MSVFAVCDIAMSMKGDDETMCGQGGGGITKAANERTLFHKVRNQIFHI